MAFQTHPELLPVDAETAPPSHVQPAGLKLLSWLRPILRLLDNWIVDQGRQIQYEQDLEKESGMYWGGPFSWHTPYRYRRYL